MTTPRPQDTDPLRAQGTDREPVETPSERAWREALARPSFRAALDAGLADLAAGRTERWDDVKRRLAHHRRYPGWSTPPGPLSRLVAWVRKWRRG